MEAHITHRRTFNGKSPSGTEYSERQLSA